MSQQPNGNWGQQNDPWNPNAQAQQQQVAQQQRAMSTPGTQQGHWPSQQPQVAQVAAQTTDRSANDILMGAANAPAWKFQSPGVTKSGVVCSAPQTRQEREYDPNNPGGGLPKTYPSGDPIWGIHVEVQTDEVDTSKAHDDGKRTFYVEGRRVKDALRTAIRNSGAAGLEVGGRIDVTLDSYSVPGDRRSGINWVMRYTPASAAAPVAVPAGQAATAFTNEPVSAADAGRVAYAQQQQQAAAAAAFAHAYPAPAQSYDEPPF